MSTPQSLGEGTATTPLPSSCHLFGIWEVLFVSFHVYMSLAHLRAPPFKPCLTGSEAPVSERGIQRGTNAESWKAG